MKLDRVIAVRNSKTVYRDGDRCIKVFNADYSKADVLNEALNQARIEATGLPVPRILEVTMLDGKWAIVSEFIKGKTLDRLMVEDPQRKPEYLALLAELQISVLGKTCPDLPKLKDKMGRRIIDTQLDATIRYDLHTRLMSMPKHNKICHGDLNPSNVILDESQKPYILDWSHATQGNASADVAGSYLQMCLKGDREGADTYLDIFCRKSGTERRYIQRWLPLVAAAMSHEAREHDRELLLSWVNAIDYE